MDARQIRNNSIISRLKSGNDERILSAIDEIRIHGNVEILPSLISLIFMGTSEISVNSAVNVLNDLKENSAVPIIMEAINSYRGKKNFHLLVASCWQNGLDFSPYMDSFLELAVAEDIEVAIEAYSVIEENMHNLNDDEKKKLSDLIRSKATRIQDDCKMKLIVQLANQLDHQLDFY